MKERGWRSAGWREKTSEGLPRLISIRLAVSVFLTLATPRHASYPLDDSQGEEFALLRAREIAMSSFLIIFVSISRSLFHLVSVPPERL